MKIENEVITFYSLVFIIISLSLAFTGIVLDSVGIPYFVIKESTQGVGGSISSNWTVITPVSLIITAISSYIYYNREKN